MMRTKASWNGIYLPLLIGLSAEQSATLRHTAEWSCGNCSESWQCQRRFYENENLCRLDLSANYTVTDALKRNITFQHDWCSLLFRIAQLHVTVGYFSKCTRCKLMQIAAIEQVIDKRFDFHVQTDQCWKSETLMETCRYWLKLSSKGQRVCEWDEIKLWRFIAQLHING